MKYSTRKFLGGLQLATLFGGWALVCLYVLTDRSCSTTGELSVMLVYFGWVPVLVPVEWMAMMKRGEKRDPRWAKKEWPKVLGWLIVIALAVLFAAGLVMR